MVGGLQGWRIGRMGSIHRFFDDLSLILRNRFLVKDVMKIIAVMLIQTFNSENVVKIFYNMNNAY